MAESNATQVILTDDGMKIIKAQNTADNATSGITNLNDPNLMSVIEKQYNISRFAGLTSQYNVIMQNAKDDGVDTTALTTAYNNLNQFMADVLADPNHASDIDRATYKKYQGAYNEELVKTQNDFKNSANNEVSSAANQASQAASVASQAFSAAQSARNSINNLSPYTHIAYANSSDGKTDFSLSDSNRTYLGMYVDFSYGDSTNPSDYDWSLIKGHDGEQGIPGKAGVDGKTPYFHIAYADNATGTEGFSTTDSLSKLYIGQYTDFIQADSTDPTKYLWTLIKGDKGADGDVGPKGDQGIKGPGGADGRTSYAHFAYANSQDGKTDFSTTDSNRKYIGFYSDFSSGDSNNSSDYSWSLIKGADGADGKDGVPGKAGTNGKTPYFHIAYADSSDGNTNFSLDTPGSRKYIGGYTDFTQADSINPAVYSWQLVQGPQGERGKQIFKSSFEDTPNQAGRWWSDLSPAPSVDNPPKIGDTVITLAGNIFQIDTVNVGGGGGGGTFGVGNVLGNIQGPKGDKGLQGLQGPQGNQGIKGPAGADGKSSYTHIAYGTSNSGAGFTQTPSTSTTYIGMYVDFTATDSNDPTKYAWSLIKGADGANGAPGKAGADGKTPYFHQAWADSSDGTTNFSTTVSLGKKYLGTYTDYVAADSKDPTIYKWTELVGAIEIGGTNLITGTSGPFVMGYGIPNTVWDTTNQVSGISLPVAVAHSEVLPQGNGFSYTYMPGVTYTQSIYISTDAPLTGTPISFTWFTSPYGHNTSGADNLVKVSTNVYRATSTYTWPSSYSPGIGSRNADLMNLTQVFDFTKGTFLKFYKPKLEHGNKVTDWSPAPEDLATHSQIIKLNNDINLNVKKGDLLSQINLQAGYALVSASKQLTLSSNTIYFDSANPIIIPSANITGTLEGKKLKAADIEANTFSTKNKTFIADSNGAITAKNMKLNGGTLTSPTINASTINGSTINGTTFNAGNKLNSYGNTSYPLTISSDGSIDSTISKTNSGITDILRTRLKNGQLITNFRRMSPFETGKYLAGDTNLGIGQLSLYEGYSTSADANFNTNSLRATGYTILDAGTGLSLHGDNQQITFNGTSDDVTPKGIFITPYGNINPNGTQNTWYVGNNMNMKTAQFGIDAGQNVPISFSRQTLVDEIGALGNRLSMGRLLLHATDENAQMYLLNDGKPAFVSPTIYNRTYSNGANMFVTSAGRVGRSTSASKYKLAIDRSDDTSQADRLMTLNLASWHDKVATEKIAESLSNGETPAEAEINLKRHYGLIAEDLRDAGLDEFLITGKDGQIEGIEYDRLWTVLIPKIKQLNNRINELERKTL